MDYNYLAKLNVALSDPNRLSIIDMLSCKKMNASQLLECLNISQPTLSFHMKKLIECDFVIKTKVKNEVFYQNNCEVFELYLKQLNKLHSFKLNCECFKNCQK